MERGISVRALAPAPQEPHSIPTCTLPPRTKTQKQKPSGSRHDKPQQKPSREEVSRNTRQQANDGREGKKSLQRLPHLTPSREPNHPRPSSPSIPALVGSAFLFAEDGRNNILFSLKPTMAEKFASAIKSGRYCVVQYLLCPLPSLPPSLRLSFSLSPSLSDMNTRTHQKKKASKPL